MSNSETYKHNSEPKNFIRQKWIEFAAEIYQNATRDFGILTFPAEAMQDLRLFKEEGFIDWEEVEKESEIENCNYKITKGNIRCFEKKYGIYKVLNEKLIHAKVNNDDFCSYIITNYTRILGGSDKTFPVDVVNLDFEGRLYPNSRYPFDNTIKCIFELQRNHKRNFSLFITWPVVENEDMSEYKRLLENVIESNLEDPSALSFKESFTENIGAVENLSYERKSVRGVAKIVIKKASHSLYNLDKNEFYVYGDGKDLGKQRMLSVLFNFKYDGRSGRENIIYAKDVENSMHEIIEIGSS